MSGFPTTYCLARAVLAASFKRRPWSITLKIISPKRTLNSLYIIPYRRFRLPLREHLVKSRVVDPAHARLKSRAGFTERFFNRDRDVLNWNCTLNAIHLIILL